MEIERQLQTPQLATVVCDQPFDRQPQLADQDSLGMILLCDLAEAMHDVHQLRLVCRVAWQ